MAEHKKFILNCLASFKT